MLYSLSEHSFLLQKLGKHTVPTRRQQGNQLLAELLSQHLQTTVSPNAITRGPHGQPICLIPGYFVSLSHSKSWICGMISKTPCGIDIEAINSRRDWHAIWKLIQSGKEPSNLNNEVEFYQRWTQKESLWKALGQHNFALSQIDTSDCSPYQFNSIICELNERFAITTCIKDDL